MERLTTLKSESDQLHSTWICITTCQIKLELTWSKPDFPSIAIDRKVWSKQEHGRFQESPKECLTLADTTITWEVDSYLF